MGGASPARGDFMPNRTPRQPNGSDGYRITRTGDGERYSASPVYARPIF